MLRSGFRAQGSGFRVAGLGTVEGSNGRSQFSLWRFADGAEPTPRT